MWEGQLQETYRPQSCIHDHSECELITQPRTLICKMGTVAYFKVMKSTNNTNPGSMSIVIILSLIHI